MDGILVINKPSGMTSHDVVAQLRRILKEKKIGHTGTLDPDATGVLTVCIGKATKIIQFLDDNKKVYEGTITFGIETDTLDASGRVTRISDSSKIEPDSVKRIFDSFVGEILQIPPMVSAIQIKGERLYKLARQGKIVEREPRKISIREFELIKFYSEGVPEFDPDKIFSRADFKVSCSKGTYVRTLASDAGEKLGCGAHLSRLIRTRSGEFTLEDSIGLDEIKSEPNKASSVAISIDDALSFMPAIFVSDSGKHRFLNGVQIDESDVLNYEGEYQTDAFIRVYDQDRIFLGIGKVVETDTQVTNYKPVKVLGN
jgi:tRNA pseudouridine55 synthase